MLVCTAAAIFRIHTRAACGPAELTPAAAIFLSSILFLPGVLVSSRRLGARSSCRTSGAHAPRITRPWPAKRMEIAAVLLAARSGDPFIGSVGPHRLLQTVCLFMETGKSRRRLSTSKESLITSWLHARTAFSAGMQALSRWYHRQITGHRPRLTPIAFSYAQALDSRGAAAKFFRPHS